MSVSELLIVVLIVLLVSGCLAETVSLAHRHYMKSMRASQANVLASMLESVLVNELTYTTEIHVDGEGNLQSFLSQNYGREGKCSSIDVRSAESDVYGRLVFINEDNPKEEWNVLGDGAYPNKLGIQIKSITYDADHDFTVHFAIGYSDKELLDKWFMIHNENDKNK